MSSLYPHDMVAEQERTVEDNESEDTASTIRSRKRNWIGHTLREDSATTGTAEPGGARGALAPPIISKNLNSSKNHQSEVHTMRQHQW